MLRALLCFSATLVAFALPAQADAWRGTYQVRLFGFPIGQLVLATETNTTTYASVGEFHTDGIVGIVVPMQFEFHARGKGQFPNRRSLSYNDVFVTNYRRSTAQYAFAANDPRIDPLTGLLATLEDRPIAAGCGDFHKLTFDGVRSLQLDIREVSRKPDGGLTCGGQAIRTGGYSEDDMKQTSTFPFTVQFSQHGNTLVAVHAEVVTVFGKATLDRQ